MTKDDGYRDDPTVRARAELERAEQSDDGERLELLGRLHGELERELERDLEEADPARR